MAFVSDLPDFFHEAHQIYCRGNRTTIIHRPGTNPLDDTIKRNNEELEARVLERTTQLQRSNQELETFSYSVAHDLRSPLRTIAGFSTILKEDYSQHLDAEGNRNLDKIEANSLRMDILIKELLELAKLTRDSLNYRQVNMLEIVQSTFESNSLEVVKESFEIEIAELSNVNADPVLIRQVWQNLIDNAIKFSMPKARKKIVIHSSEQGDRIIYSIQDFGVGFNPEYVDKVFGIFQRLHPADQFEGTGIGLAIVKKIIDRHNGKIWVETTREKNHFQLFLADTEISIQGWQLDKSQKQLLEKLFTNYKPAMDTTTIKGPKTK